MNISARVGNKKGESTRFHFRTNEHEHSLMIRPKPDGFGSSSNEVSELLSLALATCYCPGAQLLTLRFALISLRNA